MAKSRSPRTVYRCQACGHVEARWLGRCPECQEWNSYVEEKQAKLGDTRPSRAGQAAKPIGVDRVAEASVTARIPCRMAEIDRVLGGGLVPGSLVLLGGDPGVGKSTLLVQLLDGVVAGTGSDRATVLYVSGEESVNQIAMRARRVSAVHPGLALLSETNLERILEQAEALAPTVLAVDSIQTVQTDLLESIPGAIGQVRECAARLLGYAKTSGVPTVLVGHVTKDGAIAGPKTLEHVVDAVLQFDGEGGSPYRVLRAIKNRFGSTQEIGVFEMRSTGLCEVPNPSELFLAERPLGAPGSVVVASAEGSRPILVEVQALVAPPSAAIGRRTAAGVEGNRVSLLVAVLAQRAGCDVLSQDVFVNVAGGLKLTEPAIDLGVACAVASAARNRPVDPKTVVFGEVGLAGEIRAVSLADVRLAEAAKLGFSRCLMPAQNHSRLDDSHGIEIVPVATLEAALDAL